MTPRVLFIDDLTPAHWLVSTFLSGASFEVMSSADPASARDTVQVLRPDAIVLDPTMADHSGWELLAELQSDPFLSQVPTVIYSDLPEVTIAEHATRCQYDDLSFVSKDDDLDHLLDRLAAVTGAPALIESWSA